MNPKPTRSPASEPTEIEAPLPTETTTDKLIQGTKIMLSSPQQLVALTKQNLEAMTAAGKIWTDGVQDLTKHIASTAKASMEESVATFRALSSVKSVKEAIELQTNYSKAVVAKTLAESTRLTDASLKLTEQALAPITARMAATVGSLAKAA